jgi:hypothetical protein
MKKTVRLSIGTHQLTRRLALKAQAIGLLRGVLLGIALRFFVLLLLLIEVAAYLPMALLTVSARFWGGVFDARLCGPAKKPIRSTGAQQSNSGQCNKKCHRLHKITFINNLVF